MTRGAEARWGSFVRVSVLLLLVVGCAGGEDAGGDAPAAVDDQRRVESPGLAIAVADLPEGLAVEEGSQPEDEIRLRASATGIDGLLVVSEDAPQANPNMVAAIEAHQALIESREDGVYGGQRELAYPFGPAFYSRGQYSEGGRPMEETIVVALHPAKRDRLLRLTYTYPVGEDTAERLNDHLFALLGEIEPLAASADDSDPASSAPPAP